MVIIDEVVLVLFLKSDEFDVRFVSTDSCNNNHIDYSPSMREIIHLQFGQCGLC